MKRLTVGLLTNYLMNEVSTLEWAGAVDAAARLNVDLVCFTDRALNDPTAAGQSDDQLFRLADTGQLDGLIIWTAMLDWYASSQDLERFARRFSTIPCVSVEKHLPGLPAVLVDDYRGMWQVVDHLVAVHGCKRIAFIRGPEGHQGVQARFQAYRDCLETRGIGLDPSLILGPCSWNSEQARALVLSLLDSGQDLVDAIVGPSESLALGALAALADRGIACPADMAVVGFDDTPETQNCLPPLSTAATPLYELGAKACELLVGHIRGEPIPPEVLIPVPMAIRQSCGCLDYRTAREASLINQARQGQPTNDDEGSILKHLESQGMSAEVIGLTRRVLAEFTALVHSGSATIPETYLHDLTAAIRQIRQSGADLQKWHASLSPLRLIHHDSSLASDLWHVLGTITNQITSQARTLELVRLKNKNNTLLKIGQALITTFDLNRIFHILPEWLPLLGIPSCFIALFRDPDQPTGQVTLRFAYSEGQAVPLPPEGITYPALDLIPAELKARSHPVSWLVEPLDFEGSTMGFIVFEAGPHDGIIYEALRAEISSGLQGALLLAKIRERSQALEESLEHLKLTQQQLVISEKMSVLGGLVAGVAHEVNTPIGNGVTATSFLLEQTKRFRDLVDSGTLSRSELARIMLDIDRSATLVQSNLEKAAGLVRYFKQVSVDQSNDPLQDIELGELLSLATGGIPGKLPGAGFSLRVDCPSGIIMITYPLAIAQLISNLAANSLQHGFCGRERGTISITARVTDSDTVEIIYRDDGVGMASEELGHLFEPFYSSLRHQGSSGLGTYIVYNLVTQRLAGTISAESAVGQGLAYCIRLPRVLAPVSAPGSSDHPDSCA